MRASKDWLQTVFPSFPFLIIRWAAAAAAKQDESKADAWDDILAIHLYKWGHWASKEDDGGAAGKREGKIKDLELYFMQIPLISFFRALFRHAKAAIDPIEAAIASRHSLYFASLSPLISTLLTNNIHIWLCLLCMCLSVYLLKDGKMAKKHDDAADCCWWWRWFLTILQWINITNTSQQLIMNRGEYQKSKNSETKIVRKKFIAHGYKWDWRWNGFAFSKVEGFIAFFL